MIYAIVAVASLAAGLVLYLLFAPGPRRWRAYHRARKHVQAGDWLDALQIVTSLRPERQSSTWQARLYHVAGEARQQAVDATLKKKEFEEALEHARESADLLGLDLKEQEARVLEGALAEVRRLFAAGPGETAALQQMIARVAKLAGTEPAEATFWQAMGMARQGNMEPALDL